MKKMSFTGEYSLYKYINSIFININYTIRFLSPKNVGIGTKIIVISILVMQISYNIDLHGGHLEFKMAAKQSIFLSGPWTENLCILVF